MNGVPNQILGLSQWVTFVKINQNRVQFGQNGSKRVYMDQTGSDKQQQKRTKNLNIELFQISSIICWTERTGEIWSSAIPGIRLIYNEYNAGTYYWLAFDISPTASIVK